MPVNIICLVKDRPNLTSQCFKSLYENTPEDQFNLTILSDGSLDDATLNILDVYGHKPNARLIVLLQPIGIVGWLRNVGASASERYFGRGEYLCHIDNDIYFRPNWLQKMIFVAQSWSPDTFVLGGYQHPFHGTNRDWTSVHETDAVAGYMHFMTWETWDKYGPYDQHSKGVCQSEDFAFCQKIVKDGGRVGYKHPPVILNCGITNSEGKPAIGSENFLRIEGVLYE